jgi:hypothetical protein
MACDLQSAPAGSVLTGSMSYGMVTLNSKSDDQNNQRSPAAYDISCLVPPSKVQIVCLFLGSFIHNIASQVPLCKYLQLALYCSMLTRLTSLFFFLDIGKLSGYFE